MRERWAIASFFLICTCTPKSAGTYTLCGAQVNKEDAQRPVTTEWGCDIQNVLRDNPALLAILLEQYNKGQHQGPPANVSVPNNDTNERIEDGTSSLSQNDVSYYRNEWQQIVSLSNIVNVYWKIIGTIFCYESRWDNCWFVIKEDN